MSRKWLLASTGLLALALTTPALAQTQDCQQRIAELDRLVAVGAGQQQASTGGAQQGQEMPKVGELAAGMSEQELSGELAPVTGGPEPVEEEEAEPAVSGELAPVMGGPTPVGKEGEQQAPATTGRQTGAGVTAGTEARAMRADLSEEDRRRARDLLQEARDLQAQGDSEACLQRVQEAESLLGSQAREGQQDQGGAATTQKQGG
jgi:hypothetical protein